MNDESPRPEGEILNAIRAVITARTENFLLLAEISGLSKTEAFRGADLSYLDLSGLDLRGFRFEGTWFHQCDLRGTDLRGTGFSRENAYGAAMDERTLFDKPGAPPAKPAAPVAALLPRDMELALAKRIAAGHHRIIRAAVAVPSTRRHLLCVAGFTNKHSRQRDVSKWIDIDATMLRFHMRRLNDIYSGVPTETRANMERLAIQKLSTSLASATSLSKRCHKQRPAGSREPPALDQLSGVLGWIPFKRDVLREIVRQLAEMDARVRRSKQGDVLVRPRRGILSVLPRRRISKETGKLDDFKRAFSESQTGWRELQEAEDEFEIANRPLLESIVRACAPSEREIDQYMRYGRRGLRRAIEGFDLRCGYRFEEVAEPYIRAAIGMKGKLD